MSPLTVIACFLIFIFLISIVVALLHLSDQLEKAGRHLENIETLLRAQQPPQAAVSHENNIKDL